ncbi:MAG: PepSY-like domain-containing protein [Acidobacteria bacterium]|nr:PepSY-like domain-containing protein [Acidobacteriota bacterium]
MKLANFSGILCLTLACVFAAEGATKLKLKDLPPAVRKSVEAETANATIIGIVREIEDGKTIYEVEMKTNGRTRSVDLDPQGNVLSTEEEVAFESLPAAAQAAILKRAAGAKVTRVEKVVASGRVSYEATLAGKGPQTEFVVGEDGSILK